MTELWKLDPQWDAKAVAAAVLWALAVPAPLTFGDPPAWAPAAGLRVKYDASHLGYTGKKWDRDFGVNDGRCNRQAVGEALEATGGNNGAPAAKSAKREVATVVGTVVGDATAGRSSGPDMDNADKACVGHTLELGELERGVTWTNDNVGTAYRVILLGGSTANGRPCREFVTRVSANGKSETVRHIACSSGDGVWQITS